MGVGCDRQERFTRRERRIIDQQSVDSLLYTYKITQESDLPTLRRPSIALSEDALASPEYRKPCERMLQTVQAPPVLGVGIAAPQVGINRRVVAVQRFDKEGEPFEIYPNISIVD